MKKVKTGKKLELSKTTIQKLQTGLGGEELREIKGGTGIVPMGTTNIPKICGP